MPMGFLLIFMATVLVIDQFTKYWVVKKMALEASIPVIKNIFHLTYVENTGAAFGLLPNKVPFFIIISLVAVVLLVVYYRHLPKYDYWLRTAVSLIMGGAVSNLIDRVRLGAVIDFLDFRIWPVFNIADTAISIGVAMLIFKMFFSKEEEA